MLDCYHHGQQQSNKKKVKGFKCTIHLPKFRTMSVFIKHGVSKRLLKFEATGNTVHVNGSHLSDSTEFIITPVAGPGNMVTVHCASGSQNGKYLKINSSGTVVTGHNVGSGEEHRFVRTSDFSILDGIKLERINTNDVLAFDQSGFPIWVTNPNDTRTTLEIIDASGFFRTDLGVSDSGKVETVTKVETDKGGLEENEDSYIPSSILNNVTTE